MNRRGNCWDNSVTESFFSNLKKERIRGRTYSTREEAGQDVFDYIGVIYNRKRRHTYLGGVSPVKFEVCLKSAITLLIRSIAGYAVILDTDSVSDAQIVNSLLRHGLISPVLKSHPYTIFILLLITLLYLVPHHGTTYSAGHGRDILAGSTTDLMSEHSANDTADNCAGTYPLAAPASYLDRVNHAICNSGIG